MITDLMKHHEMVIFQIYTKETFTQYWLTIMDIVMKNGNWINMERLK